MKLDSRIILLLRIGAVISIAGTAAALFALWKVME